MIEIAIGAPQLPILRIGSKIGTHVGVYKGLQVGAERIAEGADHDVGAHALRAVDIAVREAEDAISGVIGQRHADLPPRDRKSVEEGKSVSVRVDLGGRGSIKKKK